jgi:hypothetical protein
MSRSNTQGSTTARRTATPRNAAKTGRSAAVTPGAAAAAPTPTVRRGVSAEDMPPPFDGEAVKRLAGRVEIESIDLIGAHFDRADDAPLEEPLRSDLQAPELGLSYEWELASDASILGCTFTFAAWFETAPGVEAPYELFARFRLQYSVGSGPRLSDEDIHQFAAWNSMFNAWPYWREYLSSTINRAHLPQFVVPVMRLPSPSEQPKIEN